MKIPVIRVSDPTSRAIHDAAIEAGGDRYGS